MRRELEHIAREVFKQKNKTSEGYPDCYDISNRVKKEILKQKDLDESDIRIAKYIIGDGFHHYVLEVNIDGILNIVDSSFGQFSSEYDTPVNLGRGVEDIVVVDKKRYIFEKNF